MEISRQSIVLALAIAVIIPCKLSAEPVSDKNPHISDVRVDDEFWSPKFKIWKDITINDVLDKFEGKHTDAPHAHDAFCNFDKVAAGHSGTRDHFGAPWFDGLIFESIRGIADYLTMFPDKSLENRVDAYIERIIAAQDKDGTGYLATYTQLDEPAHRWGDNGGFLRWQHDVYNAGALIEAGVHYYRATGKTRLLEAAVKCANHMAALMGPAPRRNIVPSHSLPEEAVVKLYCLFCDEPALKNRIKVNVDEKDYLDLATFWVENRGHHCGYPLWHGWGNGESERWIKKAEYNDVIFGSHSRPSWGDYAQDSIPVFQQQTIEGHAVRATLLGVGITSLALVNHDHRYISTAKRLWDNMVGKRMFITGGVGAIHEDEKFGPDYFLPPGAYLETCAAIGGAFYSQLLNELTRDAKYIDELERVIYNSLLTAVSLKGDNYTYQNPLNASCHNRWEWHGCPCCPPMFLKITSELPKYIYSADKEGNLYVNLFIGSNASLTLADGKKVLLSQETRYPWQGGIRITVNPEKASRFDLKLRVPGWARGIENPYGLYMSNLTDQPILKVNGSEIAMTLDNGYVSINRKWRKGDYVELDLPLTPRVIKPHSGAKEIAGMVCLASGPVIYSFESVDNPDIETLRIDPSGKYELEYRGDLLNGVNVIKCSGGTPGMAIPYYSIANRQRDTNHKVWVEQSR